MRPSPEGGGTTPNGPPKTLYITIFGGGGNHPKRTTQNAIYNHLGGGVQRHTNKYPKVYRRIGVGPRLYLYLGGGREL